MGAASHAVEKDDRSESGDGTDELAEDELADHELGELLPPLADADGTPDDELPTDPYVGLELPPDDEGGDSSAEGDAEGFELSIEERDSDTGGDELGIEGEASSELEPEGKEETWSGEPLEGLEREPAPLDEQDLPGLDADDEGAGLERDELSSLPIAADEASLKSAEVPWSIRLLGPEREPCTALAAGSAGVVAGSSDLFWFDPAAELPVRLGADGSRLSSLALVGETREVALCVTVAGRLLRRSRRSAEPERLTGWRRTAQAGGVSAETLELCQIGLDSRTVIARLASGRLLRSSDEGNSFELLAPEVTAIAISSRGDPVALLSRDGSLLRLSFDAGRTWDTRELEPIARSVANGEAPLVEAAGSVVLIADAERGLVVSSDGGRSFRPVPGSTNVTAFTAGELDGRPAAFASLYREAADRSTLALIDPVSGVAEAIGTIGGDEADSDAERGRVHRLVWDGSGLWAAGGFGIALVRRSLGPKAD